MKEDIFFLPFFIKEKIYVLDKEDVNFSLGIENLTIPNEKEKDVPKPNFDYLILHEEPSPLPAPQEELLQNILKAVQILPNQIEKIAIQDFQQVQTLNRKFIFVLSSAPLPKFFNQLEKNKTRTITEGSQALFSESLTTLTANKQEKIALWTELKRVFEVK